MNKIKAVSLISGGLDSALAAKLVAGQGIEVLAVNFLGPFSLRDKLLGGKRRIEELAKNLGITLINLAIHEDFLALLKNPKHGFGSNLNPCIDCHIMMLKKAKEYMDKIGGSFLVTGEVLGQRPMSQNRQSLDLIEKESNLTGLILRPLSAKLLAETIPEKMGWVKRDQLLDINGRGRKAQFALAKKLGMDNYSAPAGGCLLTDPGFSLRLKDLIDHGELNLDNIELLKVGRHFRLEPDAKLIVGRDEGENNFLMARVKNMDTVFTPGEANGPVALGKGKGFDRRDLLILAGSIISRYCDKDEGTTVNIQYRTAPAPDSMTINSVPLEAERVKEILL